MALQIYALNGYIFVNDEDNGIMKDDAGKNVIVNCSTPTSDRDDGSVFTLNSPRIGTLNFAPEDVEDENGDNYTLSTWQTFYTENTGFSPASGGSGAVVLPTGSRTPVNTVTDPETEIAWVGAANTTTSSGSIEKTTGGSGWNADANFVIPTLGDFSLGFSVTGAAMVGFSVYDVNASFETIGFALYRYAGGYIIYESGAVQYSGSDAVSHPMRIDFVANEVKYYVNEVLVRTSVVPEAIYTHGNLVFDCSINGVGDTVDDINVTFL